MHSQLEQYLGEVAAWLDPIPAARRREELREIRQHLLNATVLNRQMGQSEDEAAANAIQQFGTARELGESLILSWRRERRRKDRRDLKLAIAWTLALIIFELPFYKLFQNLVLFQVLVALLFSIWIVITNKSSAWWAWSSRPLRLAFWMNMALFWVVGSILEDTGNIGGGVVIVDNILTLSDALQIFWTCGINLLLGLAGSSWGIWCAWFGLDQR